MHTQSDYKELFSVEDGSYIGNFIEDFRKRLGDEKAKDIFCGGYCYHFASILAKLYRGFIVYYPIDNHFGFADTATDCIWDITGVIGHLEDSDWKCWELYKLEEPLDSQHIIEQCIYKVYVG